MESQYKEKEYQHNVREIYRKEWATATPEKREELYKRMRRWQELMNSGLPAQQAYYKAMEEELASTVAEEPSDKSPRYSRWSSMPKVPSVILVLALIAAIVYSVVTTMDRNTLNTEFESVQSALASTQSELGSTKETLASTQSELASTEVDLSSTKQKLSSTQTELSSTKQTLTSTQSELSSTKQTLAKTQDRLEVIEAELLLSVIEVTNLSISPYYVELGEKVTISATVTNSGGIQISYPAILKINGSEVETKSVVLDAEESQVVSFTVAKESAGNYTVELGGLADTFTVSQIIKDLAYIKISASGYSDDADPESDGISLNILFYDSKSELITFQDVPVIVTIKLYSYRDAMDQLMDKNRQLIHQQQVTIDDASGFGGAAIKIPFENVMVDQNIYYQYGSIEVTVTTPKQGSFRDSHGSVSLYAE